MLFFIICIIRSLGRVGLELGTAVHSSNSNTIARSTTGTGGRTTTNETRRYVDNAMNRKLGRVGMVVGSMPVSSVNTSRTLRSPVDVIFQPLVRIDPEDNNLREIMEQITNLRNELINDGNPNPIRENRIETAIGVVNRHEAGISRYRAGMRKTLFFIYLITKITLGI